MGARGIVSVASHIIGPEMQEMIKHYTEGNTAQAALIHQKLLPLMKGLFVGMYRHFRAIAEETSLPVMLYNVPGRTAASLAPETTIRLAEIPNIIAIKEASGDLDAITKIVAETPVSPTLSEEEKVALIQYSVKEAAGRAPIIAGTGSNNTKASIKLTKKAEEAGADAVMLVTPYYNKPSQVEVFELSK
ncbi:hypothetical protein DT075_26210 [Bacillus licheniformis]|nr:hypothetical protein DT075_26210 [Bacillus licheniformis]